jgi:hypothetical protein
MMSQEYSNPLNGRPTTLGGNFTPEEVSRLISLRQTFASHSDYRESMIDERRLEFVRWLLDHGKLSEACAEL